MRISYYENYGSSEVLSIKEVEKPVPKSNEVLIKIASTTVNRSDCAMLTGKPFIMKFFTGLSKPKKQTLGTDLAGTVEAVGKNVDEYVVGDRIFIFDDSGVESQGEYTVLSKSRPMVKLPYNIPLKKAVACAEGFHYAHNFINKVKLEAGQKVMINGGTGSIGSAAIQLCKYYGLEITATCRAEHADLVKSLGADKVIDYEKEDFTKVDEKFNFVFDAVGKNRFVNCKEILLPGGAYISSELGPKGENIFLAISTNIVGAKKVKFPFPTKPMESLKFASKLIEEGHYRPVIDRVYPLEQIAEAYDYVMTGQKVGNVIIDMD